uniref:Uncharacterized protein n=1 Tax=Picocystis salinarum TaxID=88271 RepID=A0A7S3UG35_9CHLO
MRWRQPARPVASSTRFTDSSNGTALRAWKLRAMDSRFSLDPDQHFTPKHLGWCNYSLRICIPSLPPFLARAREPSALIVYEARRISPSVAAVARFLLKVGPDAASYRPFLRR